MYILLDPSDRKEGKEKGKRPAAKCRKISGEDVRREDVDGEAEVDGYIATKGAQLKHNYPGHPRASTPRTDRGRTALSK